MQAFTKSFKVLENSREPTFLPNYVWFFTSLGMHEFSITKCKSYAEAIMPVAAVLRPVDGMSW